MAALAIALVPYPDLDVAEWLGRLDALAAEARAALGSTGSPRQRAERLALHLFGPSGLRGNEADYYDPRNSFLNDVLARRLGIPITLSVVLLAVGRRLGLDLHGVGFPAHFLVRCEVDGDPPLVLDPFHGGVSRTPAQCAELLAALGHGAVPFEPALLAPIDDRALLARMLRNLKAIDARRGDLTRALAWAERLVRAAPDDPGERRDRGLLRIEAGRLGAGVEDLAAYLAAAPTAADAPQVTTRLTAARAQLWSLN